MFSKKSDFSNKRIWEIQNFNSNNSKSNFGISFIIRFILIIVCVWAVFWIWKYVISFSQATLWIITKSSIKVISNNIWQEMIKDDFGNVNILFIWYWGENHDGWYLADSIMLASWNPKLWAISFVSIPRDLFVNNPITKWWSRINVLFPQMYKNRWDLLSWASWFADKIWEILWLDINYYATIDFDWFENVIDTLWWIDVLVKNTIYDTTYPDWNKWYITFHLNAWEQHLDWKTALMYARSRHTTSDFDRSLRQQQIIDAIKNKFLSWWYMTNISKIKELYSDYSQMVVTNISMKEIIWSIKYVQDLENIFSFGLNSNCSYSNFSFMQAWCFLYVPNRDWFDWASVLLPEWASINKISFYNNIHKFVFLVAHNQEYLLEKADIIIQNWIDKSFARSIWKRADWNSNLLASKLKKYWFNISKTENATSTLQQTTIYVPYTWSFTWTIKILSLFFDAQIQTDESLIPSNNVVIVLWNDYIQSIKDNWFKNNL